jgi:hypothetical protein
MDSMLVFSDADERHCTFRGHKVSVTPQGELAVVQAIAALRSKVIGPITDADRVKREYEAAKKYLNDRVPSASKTELRRHRFPGEGIYISCLFSPTPPEVMIAL